MKGLDYLVFSILGLVILGGAFFLQKGLRNVWRGLASASWPRTVATVTQSGTHSSTDVDNQTGQQTTFYTADLVFEYNVGGKQYTTSTLHFGQTFGSASSADAEILHLRYAKGATVTVAYNPSDPSLAVVEPGFSLESLLLIVAGLAFILPCVMAGLVVKSMEGGFGFDAMMPIVIGIFASIFAVLGIAALCAGVTTLSRAFNSVHWPTAPGVVRYAQLQTQDRAERVNDGMGGTSTEHTEDYSTNVVYEFEVNDQKYFGNVRKFGVLNGDLIQEEAARDKYPVGAKVNVAYSPVNPNIAVLEPGAAGPTYAMAGVGLGCLFFASVIFLWIIPDMLRHPF